MISVDDLKKQRTSLEGKIRRRSQRIEELAQERYDLKAQLWQVQQELAKRGAK